MDMPSIRHEARPSIDLRNHRGYISRFPLPAPLNHPFRRLCNLCAILEAPQVSSNIRVIIGQLFKDTTMAFFGTVLNTVGALLLTHA